MSLLCGATGHAQVLLATEPTPQQPSPTHFASEAAAVLPGLTALSPQSFLQLLVARSVEVQYSQLSTEVTQHLRQAEGALYESTMFVNMREEGRSRQRTADERLQNTFTAGTAILDESAHSDEFGIRNKLPTGADMTVSYKLARKSNNLIPQTASFDTEYNVLLNLTLKQPLLRNSGQEITETDRRVAELEHDISLHQLTQQTLKTSIDGLNLYWQLHRAQETAKLRQQALTSTQNLLADAQARLAAGKVAESSLLELQSILLNRQIEHARSQQALREAKSKLATALHLTWQESNPIVTEPTLHTLSGSTTMPESESEQALERWSPYQIARLKYEQAQTRLNFAHNQMKPVADLVFSYSGTGYDNKVQAARSVTEQSSFPDWFFGVNFELPLQSNRKAQEQYLAQSNRVTQAELEISAVKNSFVNDIPVRLYDLSVAQQVLLTTLDEVKLRQNILDIENQRAKIGMGSLSTLIQKQVDLTEAKQRQLENQVRYELALVTWQYTQGNLLAEHQIEISAQAKPQQ